MRDSAGNLYGTTYTGGLGSLGTVFKLLPNRQINILHSFFGGAMVCTPTEAWSGTPQEIFTA